MIHLLKHRAEALPLDLAPQVLDYSVGLNVGHNGVGGGPGHLAAAHSGQDMWDMAMMTEEGDRVWLRNHSWRRLACKVPVVNGSSEFYESFVQLV